MKFLNSRFTPDFLWEGGSRFDCSYSTKLNVLSEGLNFMFLFETKNEMDKVRTESLVFVIKNPITQIFQVIQRFSSLIFNFKNFNCSHNFPFQHKIVTKLQIDDSFRTFRLQKDMCGFVVFKFYDSTSCPWMACARRNGDRELKTIGIVILGYMYRLREACIGL